MIVLLLALACGPDAPVDPDPDGDGVLGASDCDPADPAVGGATVWYLDLDEDGWGAAAEARHACEAPNGHVAVAGDCDDLRRDVHPAAVERCDTEDLDEDCDGLADDADPDATEPLVWYVDADADGAGVTTLARESCDPSTAETDASGDCDDADATIHPGAEERCGDGIDQDCDGDATDCRPTNTVSGALRRIDGVAIGDLAASALAVAPDLDGDGAPDLLVGAPLTDPDGSDQAGSVYVLPGPPSGALSTAWMQVHGASADADLGRALVGMGDLTGDGLGDLAVGAPGTTTSGGTSYGGAGTIYLVAAAAGPTSALAAYAELNGPVGAGCGAVLDAGPMDGDDSADLVIGCPHAGSSANGAVFVASGATSGPGLLSEEALAIDGDSAYDHLGTAAIFAGDTDGDGLAEVLVGAPWYGVGGGAWLLEPELLSGAVMVDDAEARIEATGAGHDLGRALAGAADADGDGYDDVAVASPFAGTVWLFAGGLPVESTTDGATATLEAPGEEAGAALAFGDVDADGFADLVIGAPAAAERAADGGAVYVSWGPSVGAIDLPTSAMRVDGDEAGARVGDTVAVGDLDLDGDAEIVLGAPGSDEGGSNAGSLWILPGSGW